MVRGGAMEGWRCGVDGDGRPPGGWVGDAVGCLQNLSASSRSWPEAPRAGARGEEPLARGRARYVDQAVARRGGAPGHEPLMELVAHRVEPGQREREEGGAEAPAPLDVERPVEEEAQDQVLGEVRDLANALVHGTKLGGCSAGKEGGEEREEKCGRAFVREPASRERPYDARPRDCGQPATERTGARHISSLGGRRSRSSSLGGPRGCSRRDTPPRRRMPENSGSARRC